MERVFNATPFYPWDSTSTLSTGGLVGSRAGLKGCRLRNAGPLFKMMMMMIIIIIP
jgi:hypothetical protein